MKPEYPWREQKGGAGRNANINTGGPLPTLSGTLELHSQSPIARWQFLCVAGEEAGILKDKGTHPM